MPCYVVHYQHPNGTLTEIAPTPREADSAEDAVLREKRSFCFQEDDETNRPPNALELEARYFAFRKRMDWDGDLIATEVAAPPPRSRKWTPRIIAARSTLEQPDQ